MGFDLTPTLYSTIADLISLQSQDNAFLFSGISTGSLVSVDLSIDDIVALMGTGYQSMTSSGALSNIESDIQIAAERLTPPERIWISWIGRGLLSWSLRRSSDLSSMLTTGSQAQLYSTIIDRRNDTIIRYIQDHPTTNIVVVY